MNCKICNRMIKTKVNWQNLFSVPKYLLCDSCSRKYIPDMKVDEYEYNDLRITTFCLYNKRHMIDPNCFLIEFSSLFEYIFNRYALDDYVQSEVFTLIWNDNLDIIKNEKILTLLTKLTNNELLIISTYK